MLSMTNATVKILRALADRPDGDYAYRLKDRAGVASGTVYPILQRLEEAGWVEGWWCGHGRTTPAVLRIHRSRATEGPRKGDHLMTEYRQYLIGGHYHGQDKLDFLASDRNNTIFLPTPIKPEDLFNTYSAAPFLDEDRVTYRRERMSIFGNPITVWVSDQDLGYGNAMWEGNAGRHVGEILLAPHIRPVVRFGRRPHRR